ncbi:MAG: FAD-binding oxidoreductase [Candidatus Angelobacter sp.]
MVKNTRKRPVLATIAFVIISFLLFAAKKVVDYAAPPSGVKDCDFIFPKPTGESKLTILIADTHADDPSFEKRGGYINDASCLNKTPVYGIVKIRNVEDIRRGLKYARDNRLVVSVAGQRHSMGGQTFTSNGLVLDMRDFNKLELDTKSQTLKAQTGATWQQIQYFLDAKGLAVAAMQSINIFTVGGSMSVNAHGIAHRPGPMASTVRSFRIMLDDGEIKNASPDENPELFKLALGGYGLFGVLLDADIQVVKNEVYERRTEYMGYKDVTEYYNREIANNDNVGLFYGRLSVSPASYLEEAAVHVYKKVEYDSPLQPLQEPEHDWVSRLVINFSKTGPLGRRVRWALEKHAEAGLHQCISRNQAMNANDGCLVTRNQEMADSMKYLKNRLHDTDILQEYFIPPQKMGEFVDGLRTVVTRNRANLLNVTLRIVPKDNVTALPYAKQDMFAFVLYFNQKLNEKDAAILQKTTTDLIDLTIGLKGTYYLPYQLYYSREQLYAAYPEIGSFFAAKKKYDPLNLFGSKFYAKYGN